MITQILNPNAETFAQEQTTAILVDARAHGQRGSEPAYNTYKFKLNNLNLTAREYERAIFKLSSILKV